MKDKHDDTEWLFGGEKGEGGEWEAHRRFISPEFNPIYRQGVIGPHHLREANFSEFLVTARTDSTAAAERLRIWINTDRPQGGDFGDLAMDRIAARASGFDAETALGVVAVFADIMDEYGLLRPKQEMFFDIWEQSESILRTFKASVPEFDLERIAGQIAHGGRALSWMISAIGRTELWAHGLAGDRRKEPEQHYMSDAALQAYLTSVFERVSALKVEDLLALPNLGRLLFTLKESPWHKQFATRIFGRLAGPRTSDAIFLAFLEAMAGVVVSSAEGVYHTISILSLRNLLGEEFFERRWSRLLKSALEPELSDQLQRIQGMISAAKDW